MTDNRDRPAGVDTPAWHALLAPLPPHATVRRQPVVPASMVGNPEVEAIAGWESLTVELSAGPAGLRVIMVTLDATGTPISAGDTVLYCIEPAESGQREVYITENIGGRIEADGSFRGTRWRTRALASEDDEDQPMESASSAPSNEDIAALLELVTEVMRLGR